MNFSKCWYYVLFACLFFISCQDANVGGNFTNKPLSSTIKGKTDLSSDKVSKKLAKKVALNFSKKSSFKGGYANRRGPNKPRIARSTTALQGLKKEQSRMLM